MAAQDDTENLQKLYVFFRKLNDVLARPGVSVSEMVGGNLVRVTGKEAFKLLKQNPRIRAQLERQTFTPGTPRETQENQKLIELVQAYRKGQTNPALYELFQASNNAAFKTAAPEELKKEVAKPSTQEEKEEQRRVSGGAVKKEEEKVTPEEKKEVVEKKTEQAEPQEPKAEPVPPAQPSLSQPAPTTTTPEAIIQAASKARVPGFVKDIASKLKVSFIKNRHKLPIVPAVGTILGGALGFFGTGGLAGGAVGAVTGYFVFKKAEQIATGREEGAPPPTSPSQGTSSSYFRPNFSRLRTRMPPVSFPGKIFKKVWWRNPLVLILFLILFLFPLIYFFGTQFLRDAALWPPYLTGTGGSGNIAACTFYRGGDSTPGLKFRIQEWPALINEVASKVGVPAPVLAGILRVECPDCFYTDNPEYIKNDYDAHGNGLVYGVMQFYPSTFEDIFNKNKQQLKDLFNKDSVKTTIDPQDKMAPNNVFRIYSIKDSVIAAAFKIKADAGINPPYDREAIDKIVKAYFTQCEYFQGTGIFNYCDDLWKSYSECRSISPPVCTEADKCEKPIPPNIADSELKQAILDQFGINMIGFGTEYLRYAWEKFWDISNTKFFQHLKNRTRAKGTIIDVRQAGGSQQFACGESETDITLQQAGRGGKFDKTTFTTILLHELGHILYWCVSDADSYRSDHDKLYVEIKGMTGYGRAVDTTENYPEMITYYLHPGVTERTHGDYSDQTNIPFAGGKNPSYFALVQKILGYYPQ